MGRKETNVQISATVNIPLSKSISQIKESENRTFSTMVEILLTEAVEARNKKSKK